MFPDYMGVNSKMRKVISEFIKEDVGVFLVAILGIVLITAVWSENLFDFVMRFIFIMFLYCSCMFIADLIKRI